MKAWEATVRKTQAAAKKRAHSIFGSTFVAPGEDEEYEREEDEDEEEDEEDEEGEGEIYNADRILSNGDYYTGQWLKRSPHGEGTYLWKDGCMYVGEWHKGKTTGKGRFTWPSGDTYEGEFKGGYMDGKGTYTSSNDDTFRGFWVMNLMHGHGVKNYENGDCYDGEWCQGQQEGHGRYQWSDGSHYVGEWKGGVICGNGTFIWTNGNRYDGCWEDGLPKGNGTFKWPDESFYEGNWNKDPKEQSGTFHPEGTSPEWDPQDVFNVDLTKYKVCPDERVSVMPFQKKKLTVLRSSKSLDSNVRPQRMSVDSRIDADMDKEYNRMRILESVGSSTCDAADKALSSAGRDLDDSMAGLLADDMAPSRASPMRIPKVVKRQGEAIPKGHKNYELMLNLQLGIRYNLSL